MSTLSHGYKARICLVHLVRQCNGIDAFRKFITAYKRHDAGVPHTLLFVFKGFDGEDGVSEYWDCLIGMEYKKLFVADQGFDIGSYMEAFQMYHGVFDYFCFLNSYSEPLHEGWLELLFRHVSLPRVGIVGATGSWQSHSSAHDFRVFSYARSIKPFRRVILRALLPFYGLRWIIFFPWFPNVHVRTNGFFMSTQILNNVIVHPIKDKMDAYRFESGRNSLTRQIQNMGLRSVIAGADGKAYEVCDWPFSNVFLRSKQENLLIADNQTRTYSDADENLKVRYSFYAWGKMHTRNLGGQV